MSKYSEKVKRRQEAELELQKRELNYAKVARMFLAARCSIKASTPALPEGVYIETTPSIFSRFVTKGRIAISILATEANVQLLGRLTGEVCKKQGARTTIDIFSTPIGGKIRCYVFKSATTATTEGQPIVQLVIKPAVSERDGKHMTKTFLAQARGSPQLLLAS